jgi:hypothetical protein
MEGDLYSEAIGQFEWLESDPTYIQDAKWYKALCYLALKDKENARSALKVIKRQGGAFKQKSKEILGKI